MNLRTFAGIGLMLATAGVAQGNFYGFTYTGTLIDAYIAVSSIPPGGYINSGDPEVLIAEVFSASSGLGDGGEIQLNAYNPNASFFLSFSIGDFPETPAGVVFTASSAGEFEGCFGVCGVPLRHEPPGTWATNFVVTPEPSFYGVLGAGILGLAFWRRALPVADKSTNRQSDGRFFSPKNRDGIG